MASGMRLLDLPDEILLSIISFYPDRRSLRSLTCVNRRINDLAEPFLYNTIGVVHGSQATALAHGITTKHARATWIQSLLVSTKFGEDHGLSSLPPQISLMRNLQHLRLETPDCNIKPAHQRIHWVQLQERYERIFESSSLLIPAAKRTLPNLRSCTLHFVDDQKEIYSLSKYAMLFLHPNLRVLTVSCASTDYPDKLLTAFQSDPSLEKQTALEYLHLEECDIHEPSLAIILSFPKALKAFKLSEGVRYSPIGGFHPRRHGDVDLVKFVNALAKHCQDSLEWLSLSLGYIRRPQQSIDRAGQYLDLTDFYNIRHLELDARTTFLIIPAARCDHNLWRRLPPRVESIKIFEIPLGNHPPFLPFGREYWPFSDCVVKQKARHGLQNLTLLTYSYTTHTHDADPVDSDEDDDGDGDGDGFQTEVNHFQQTKARLVAAAEASFPTHKAAFIRLQIVLVSLPRGFIPPYLNAEESPTEVIIWDCPIS